MAFFLVKMFSYKESAGRFTFVFTLNVFNLFRLMTRWHGLFRIEKNRPIGGNKAVWCWSKSQLTFACLSLPINTVFVRPLKFIVFNFYSNSSTGSVIANYITNTNDVCLWNGICSIKSGIRADFNRENGVKGMKTVSISDNTSSFPS